MYQFIRIPAGFDGPRPHSSLQKSRVQFLAQRPRTLPAVTEQSPPGLCRVSPSISQGWSQRKDPLC